ncbi:MAG: response regulator [Solirubrobacterales bacterium]
MPTALVVEDDGEWLRILRNELLRAGFKIDWASDREEAMHKVAEPYFAYDVVFLDPNLDDSLGGLSGRAVADKLGARNPDADLVLVSGFATSDALAAEYSGLAVNVRGIFEKSTFDLSLFRELIFEVRGVRGTAEALFTLDPSLAAARELVRLAEAGWDKGVALEDLVIRLLSGIPLLEFAERRVRTATSEIDAVFHVAAAPGTLCQEWGGLLLVECRNRKDKFAARDVSSFAQTLEHRDAKVGIVVSMAGLTGKDGRDARGKIDDVYLRSRRLIIVLDEGDIDAVLSGEQNLYEMLRERDMALRLGK